MYRVYCDDFLIYDTKIEDLTLVSPKLELELNKTGSFTFTIYPQNPYYNKLKKLKSIIRVYQNNYLLFRGRILNDEEGFYNQKQVTCEGELAFLLDSIQRPYDLTGGGQGVSVEEFFTFLINNHNSQVDADKQFKVGTITVTDPNDYLVRADSTYMNTFDSITKKLIDSYGGYLWVRHEEDGNYIDYLADFDRTIDQTVEFGQNLLDYKRAQNGEEIATAIIPLGATPEAEEGEEKSDKKLTIESVNDGKDYVFDADAVAEHGWIFKTVEWSDVTDPSNLKRKGEEYLATSIAFENTIELTAVDLSAINTNISAFKLGRYVQVTSKYHDVNSMFLVNKLSIDLVNPSSNKLTLGTTYSSLTDQTHNSSVSNGNIENIISNVQDTISNIDSASIIYEAVQQSSSVMNQTAAEILQQVQTDYYLKNDAEQLIQSINTQFSQTNEEFEFRFNEFSKDIADVQSGTDAKFQNISKYIRFIDGNIVLGEEGNKLTLRIENDQISFLENGYVIAYWKNRRFYVEDGEFLNSLKLGNFAFMPRTNGNLSFKKVN